MKLFEKRPLSLILCIMLGGFSLFSVLKPIYSIIALCISALLFVSSFLFKIKLPIKIHLARIALIAFSLSLLWSQIFVLTFYPTNYYDEESTIYGTVISSDHTQPTQSTLIVDVDTIDGSHSSHTIMVKASKSQASGINRGDEIKFSAVIKDFENTTSFDTKGYYNSIGYSAQAEMTDMPLIVDRNNHKISVWIDQIREEISTRFMILTDTDTGGLLTALVIGDRSGLDTNTMTNFNRTGTTHILAVSGMHLVIIFAAISRILKLFRINKRIATAANLVICFFYVALTGFASSVTRAFVMMLVSGILYLLSESRDSITSLFISVFIIILVQPYSVYDLSLWLSAFAALGVICYGELFADKLKGKNILTKFFYYIIGALLTTVFALSATFAICASDFEGFSLIGTVATVVLSPFFTFLLYAGILLLIVGDIIPFGFILSAVTDFIKYITDLASSSKWIMASFDFIYVKIAVIFLTVFLALFLVLSFKRKKLATLILLTLYLTVNVLGLVGTQISRYTDEITYESVNGADTFLIKSDGASSLIYAGGSRTAALYNACDIVTESKLTYIDNIIITHYDENTAFISDILLSSARCDYLYVPEPKSSAELDIAEELALSLASFSAKLKFYKSEEPIPIGSVRYTMLYRETYKPEGLPICDVFIISSKAETITYVSQNAVVDGFHNAKNAISVCQSLIIGGYGDKLSEGYEFDLRFKNIKRILFSTSIPLEYYTEQFYLKNGANIIYQNEKLNLIR